MVKNHINSDIGSPLLPLHGLLFLLIPSDILYALSHRQDNTYHSLWYTSRGSLVGMEKCSIIGPLRGFDPITKASHETALQTELNPPTPYN